MKVLLSLRLDMWTIQGIYLHFVCRIISVHNSELPSVTLGRQSLLKLGNGHRLCYDVNQS